MQDVEIYDKRNPERFLGTIKRPFDKPRAPNVRMAMVRMASSVFDPHLGGPETYPVFHDVCFDLEWRIADNGWKSYIVFLTDAPLADLQCIKTFRFPDEEDDVAFFRSRRR